jgi:hypothetical protein
MTLNGKKAALVASDGGICSEEAIAIEVPKNKTTYTVVITHRCRQLNAEMIRLAASIN